MGDLMTGPLRHLVLSALRGDRRRAGRHRAPATDRRSSRRGVPGVLLRGPSRPVALLLAAASTTASLVVLPAAPAVSAPAPAVALQKSAPTSVLAGAPIRFSLEASNPSSNPGAAPEYNASFRDVLPVGVTYRAGSTTPADAGDPTVYTDPGTGRQTLVWRDVVDLQKGASATLAFDAVVDDAVLPVGSTVTNTGSLYASTQPRFVPRFDATGAPVASPSVQSATSTTTTTSISALDIAKSEPSPESELLRGVPDQATVYTLTVTESGRGPSTGVQVVDYLPADQEFLGCGGVDNSSAPEFPGAPSLATGRTLPPSQCPTPTSVDTVVDPAGRPAGVYTVVTWDVGDLAASQVTTIRYLVGVPLHENVAFAGGPSATSLRQGSNLDNNTGPSTRQDGPAAASTNTATATGTYAGNVAPGSPRTVTASDSHTVTVNDLRLHKAVSPGQFVAGQVATYTLGLDASEYVDASAITITDTIPNGICPLDDRSNYTTGAPAECAPGAGFAPSVPYSSVTQNADGTFTVVFEPVAVPRDGTLTITYSARMRTTYTGGPLGGTTTAAGDSYLNTAVQEGTTTPVAGTGETGDLGVTDPTSAGQTTTVGSLAKTVAARAVPMDCGGASYGATLPTFLKGDRVCFEVTSTFSTTNDTRNPVLTDFLPANLTYEDASVTYPGTNTVPAGDVRFDSTGGALTWTLGAAEPDGSLSVPAGSVFVARFSAIVTGPAAGPAPDKPGNIVKLRTENSQGAATSSRDQVDFRVTAPPPLSVTKGVASVDGAPSPANGPDVDHVQVQEGSVAVFRVDVTNGGTTANANAVPVSNTQVWDVLAAGVTCAQVSAVSDGGTCTDPGDPGQPSFAANATRSAVTWTLAAALAPGASREVTYAVTVSAPTSVSTDFVDTASVRSYETQTDLPGTVTSYPADNVDTSVPSEQWDAPAASDTSDVFLADVAVTKGVVSDVAEPGNAGGESTPQPSTQAVVGEASTFTVTARVPAHATVFDGTLTDALPAGLTPLSATAGWRADAASTGPLDPLPAGVTFDAATRTLTFPTTYDNTSATDQLFVVTVRARVTDTAGNVAGAVLTNTAGFDSSSQATGGVAWPTRRATATVAVVEPLPTLTKTNDVGGAGASADQVVTYTLTPGNTAGRSPLHDGWVADCLPGGLTFAAYGALPAGVTTQAPTAGTGSNGCASGTTLLAWSVGTLDPGTTLTLTNTATVDPDAAGQQSLTNVAALTGDSLAGPRTGPTDPGATDGRLSSTGAQSTVTIAGATLTKSVSPGSATVGQGVTYTVTGTLPAGVTFYDLSLVDTVPAGLRAIALTGVTCTNADNTACGLTSATPLTPAASGSATRVGWLLGDAASSTQRRTVVLTYTATVADVPAASRTTPPLTNAAHLSWDTTASTPPTSAGATYDQSSPDATAALTVTEPLVSVAKAVTRTNPAPGDTVGYTVTVSTSGAGRVSPAYGVTVTDQVPTGVVVQAATISGGGTITGQDANGSGGTISWTVPGPLVAGSPVALTYQATLAPSGTLTTAGLTNRATVTGYDSLGSGGRHYSPSGVTATRTITPVFPRLTDAKTTPNGTTAYVGESFPWRVTVTNTGGTTAQQVGATDVLPPGWTYTAGSAVVVVNGAAPTRVDPTVTTSGTTQTLTWTALGALPPGTALTITYASVPTPAATTDPGVGLSVAHTNTVTATAQDATGATGNATGPYGAPAATAAARIASTDLRMTKTVGRAPTAGGTGTWVLTVDNRGPDPATGPFTVTDGFTDPLPAGATVTSVTGTGWSCATGAPIRCTRTSSADTLAANAAFPPVTVTYAVDAAVTSGTSYSNTASVSGHTYDRDPSNDSSTATTAVTTSADLAVTKQVSSSEVVAGRDLSWTLGVTNAGPSAAAGPVRVRDTLPAGLPFVSLAAPGWTCQPITPGTDAATVDCVLGDGSGALAVGQVPDAIVVTVHVPSDRTADIANTATVGSPTPDPVPSSSTSTVSVPVTTAADVSIDKRHLTSPFVAGSTATYRLTVADAGPSDASGVVVTDVLPATLSYRSTSSGDAAWSCSATGQTVTCSYAGTLVAGAAPTSVDLVVDVSPAFTGSVSNTATVTASTPDPIPVNDSSTDDSSVDAQADLSVTKTHTGSAVAGRPFSWRLAVANAGPSDVASPVTVTDPLPAGVAYVSATGTGWTCSSDPATRVVTCTRASLAAATSAPPVTVTVDVLASTGPGSLANTAAVSSAVSDPDLLNDSSSDSVTVSTASDLTVAKRLTSPVPVVAGTDAVFVLSARSAGPSDAQGVVVTDVLDPDLGFVSATGSGWDCGVAGSTVTCTRDTLAAGTTAPDITLTTRVSPSTAVTLPAGTATLTNSATVDATTTGGRTGSGPVDVPVQAQADLALTKTATPSTVLAGRTVTWTVTASDTGPSDAAGPLTVHDTLPAGQSYVSASGAGWSCSVDTVPPFLAPAQALTCVQSVGLAAGASAPPLQVVVLVDPAAPVGPQTNTATVTSPTPGTPGTGTGTVTVGRSAVLTVVKSHTGTGQVGAEQDFSLAVHNDGPSVADQVQVLDRLPVGLTYVGSAGTGWTCTSATGADDRDTVTCLLAGTLGVGQDAPALTVTTTVGAAAYPSVENTATVSSTDPDLPGTGTSTDTLVVAPRTSLTVTKTHVGDLAVGTPGHYLVTVTATGPTATPGPVVVTDALPAGLTYVGSGGTGWTCSAGGQLVTCERPGELAVGPSTQVTIDVAVGPGAAPGVTNTATATAPGADPVSAQDVAPVAPLSRLSLSKELARQDGDAVTYEIVARSQGPNTTTSSLVLRDPGAPGLRLTGASGPGWVCAVALGVVTCRYDAPLRPGATAPPVTVTGVLTAAPGTTVTNVASVSGGDPQGATTASNAAVADVPTPGAPGGGTGGGAGGGTGGSGPTGPGAGRLPGTGTDLGPQLLLAMLLLGAGGVLVLVRRRRTGRV